MFVIPQVSLPKLDVNNPESIAALRVNFGEPKTPRIF